MTTCKDCGRSLHQQQEKALGEPRDRAFQIVWADTNGGWICPVTMNEHQPITQEEDMTDRSEHNLTEIMERLARRLYDQQRQWGVEGLSAWEDLDAVARQGIKQSYLPMMMAVLNAADEVKAEEAAASQPHIPDPDQPGEFVIHVAVSVEGPSRVTAEEFLHRVLPDAGTNDRGNPDHLEVTSWWIAEDDRRDRSDNDSAVFVIPGKQAEAITLLRREGLGY